MTLRNLLPEQPKVQHEPETWIECYFTLELEILFVHFFLHKCAITLMCNLRLTNTAISKLFRVYVIVPCLRLALSERQTSTMSSSVFLFAFMVSYSAAASKYLVMAES